MAFQHLNSIGGTEITEHINRTTLPMNEDGREISAMRKRLSVEIGSEGIPAAFCAERGIKEGELYISVNKTWKGESSNAAQYEMVKYGGRKNFIPMLADCNALPFAGGSIDELIFNNVFGSYHRKSNVMASFLKEASRVLADGGVIYITEMNTPNFIPDEWFIGMGELSEYRENNDGIQANSDYFRQFGLRVKYFSSKDSDIRIYRSPFPRHDGFYPIAFTLALEKVL